MRRARAAVSLLFLAHGGLIGLWATQIPLVKERLAIDPGIVGLVLLCGALGGIAAMQAAPTLVRLLGETALLRASMLVSSVALPLAACAPLVWMLAAALVVFGAGFGLVDLVMNAQAVRIEGRIGRPILSGLHGMWSLGGLLGAGLGSLLLAVLPPVWQASLVCVLAATVVLLVSGAMLPMPAGGARMPGSDGDAGMPASASGAGMPASAGGGNGARTRRPGLMLVGGMMALAFAVEGALLDWSAIFLRETDHLPPFEAGSGYAGFAAAMLLGRLTGDRVRGRFGDRRVLRSALLGGVFLAAAVLSPSPWIAIAGFALTGLMLCNVAPILFNAAGRIGDAAGAGGATRAVASAVGFGYAGVMIAPPLFGLIARQSSLTAALCLAGACCAVLGLCARALPRHALR